MHENMAEGIGAAASHPVTVQVFNQGPGIWSNVLTGLITAGAAILAVMLTHRYTLGREKRALDDKLKRERHFIATELVFLLEEFAKNCVRVAADCGEQTQDGVTVATESQPDLELTRITGDWRVISPRLMYRIRELPILLTEAEKYVDSAYENDFPDDYSLTFWEKKYQYSRLGLKALFLAIRLRKEAGLPSTRLNATSWSVQPMLMELWSEERSRRSARGRTQPQTTVRETERPHE